MSIVLIGGGSRSGKSGYALSLAREYGRRRGFLATAHAFDDEMRQRIEQHRQERGTDFITIEEPLDLAPIILSQQEAIDVLVIDCLTLWLSNVILSGQEPRFDELIQIAAESPMRCILVTNEIGCGIVPENALARRFRDLAGTLNQKTAALATEVYWVAFGIPVRIK